MDAGETARKDAEPASAGRRRASPGRVMLLLTLGILTLVGSRGARGAEPGGEENVIGLALGHHGPLFGGHGSERTGARGRGLFGLPRWPDWLSTSTTSTGTGRRGTAGNGEELEPEAGPGEGHSAPGITRFRDLRGLSGSRESDRAGMSTGPERRGATTTGGELEPEAGPGESPNAPGITRFRDLRGLGGTFYYIYGPRTLSRALGLGPTSRLQVYGWLQNSFTGNPSQPADGMNFGVNPNHLANQWMGNQYYLVVEDKVNTDDTVNFGFRVDSLFGNDWQFNHMHGLFDTSFRPNHFAGFDPAQFFAEVHLPILTRGGLDIRGGRWFSILGFESVPAVTRPLLSVPYMFNYGQPFTHFGVLSTLHLTDHIKVYNGTVNGWDRWINEHDRWGYIGGFIWALPSGRTSISAAMVWGPNQFANFLPANTEIVPTGTTPPPFLAGRRNLGYGSNDRTLFSAVLAHWWSDKLLQVVETDEGFENNIPGLGPGGTAQNASWYGLGNWFLRALIMDEDFHVLSGVWRAEVFRDNNGARTGFADTFYETTLGLIYRPKPWLWVRPEARYDWAEHTHPYNAGHSGSQFTLAFDVVVLF